MFIRTKFVTNSSSTSFIFYGMDFHGDEYDGLVRLLKKRGKIAENTVYGEFDDVSMYVNSIDPDIKAHFEWESRGFQIYAAKSYCDLEECGIDEMPMDKLVSLYGKEGDWRGKLIEFADKLELSGLPNWLIALHIDR